MVVDILFESRIVSEFTGWRFNASFVLANGQVWKQLDYDIYFAESGFDASSGGLCEIMIERSAYDRESSIIFDRVSGSAAAPDDRGRASTPAAGSNSCRPPPCGRAMSWSVPRAS